MSDEENTAGFSTRLCRSNILRDAVAALAEGGWLERPQRGRLQKKPTARLARCGYYTYSAESIWI